MYATVTTGKHVFLVATVDKVLGKCREVSKKTTTTAILLQSQAKKFTITSRLGKIRLTGNPASGSAELIKRKREIGGGLMEAPGTSHNGQNMITSQITLGGKRTAFKFSIQSQ